jgi:hypothetical protein
VTIVCSSPLLCHRIYDTITSNDVPTTTTTATRFHFRSLIAGSPRADDKRFSSATHAPTRDPLADSAPDTPPYHTHCGRRRHGRPGGRSQTAEFDRPLNYPLLGQQCPARLRPEPDESDTPSPRPLDIVPAS